MADLAKGSLRTKLPQLERALTGRVRAHQRFLIAHQGFSQMMETFVAEKLIDYDRETMTATLTDAGRQFIA